MPLYGFRSLTLPSTELSPRSSCSERTDAICYFADRLRDCECPRSEVFECGMNQASRIEAASLETRNLLTAPANKTTTSVLKNGRQRLRLGGTSPVSAAHPTGYPLFWRGSVFGQYITAGISPLFGASCSYDSV